MENNIKIDNLNALYEAGLRDFTEGFLKEKAEKGQDVVYSINGQIIKLSGSDAKWLYQKLCSGLEDWEVDFLKEQVSNGNNMRYILDNQTLEIPASAVLELFERLKEDDK